MEVLCQGQIPVRATEGAAGYDLHAAHAYTIRPGEMVAVKTGTRLKLRSGMVGLLFIRSGLASKRRGGLQNGVGVIDSDYTGEIMALVTNDGQDEILIAAGDRVAQIVFMPFFPVHFAQALMPVTDRGEGGFGSTGTR